MFLVLLLVRDWSSLLLKIVLLNVALLLYVNGCAYYILFLYVREGLADAIGTSQFQDDPVKIGCRFEAAGSTRDDVTCRCQQSSAPYC